MADYKAKEKKEPTKPKDDREICRVALERYQRGIERDRENIDEAYEDLKFRAGEQWDEDAKRAREKRPMLTVNRIPQFVRQVTGDMRQMRPGIKVVPVDSRGDKETAETMAGMIRYVENRSDAGAAYMSAADSQVVCGIGHIQVTTEYAADTTFNQEIRILGVDDHVGVVWDPDATRADKSDAKWCIVPTDMSREAFKENYDVPSDDFDDPAVSGSGWVTHDSVRVAVYWLKKPTKRKLALMPDGAVIDLTDGTAELPGPAKKIETRDGYKLCRYLITAAHVLEERDWPTSDIPIVPVLGEEIRIGRRIVRHGLIRFAKDPQRMYNYFRSMQTEVVALQPKAPFVGTEKNFEKYQQQWAEANSKAHPVLPYTPDPSNGGAPPQRSQPPVSSQGITEGIALAVEDMKGVIGIYDAGLGNRSNETSGKAILARQREGDTSSYVYIDNWTRGIKRVGEIVARLIPHIYDTERMIRIMGEDGKVDLKWINKPVGMQELDPETGEMKEAQRIHNDVTVGAYDIVMDTGPSYTTKREEARESMTAFIQSAPDIAPVIMDLVAKGQDWPLADEVAKRLEAIAPPPVQKLIAKQKKESGDEEQPEPPSPGEQQQAQIQQAAIQLDLENKHLANEKIKAEIGKIQGEAQGGPDPVSIVKAQAEQQRMALDARKAELEAASMQQELEIKRQIATVELEIKLADLAIKRQGLQLDTAAAAMDLQSKQQGMVHEAERHTAGLVQGMEKHQSGMAMGAESHAAKVEQMNRPEARA